MPLKFNPKIYAHGNNHYGSGTMCFKKNINNTTSISGCGSGHYYKYGGKYHSGFDGGNIRLTKSLSPHTSLIFGHSSGGMNTFGVKWSL